MDIADLARQHLVSEYGNCHNFLDSSVGDKLSPIHTIKRDRVTPQNDHTATQTTPPIESYQPDYVTPITHLNLVVDKPIRILCSNDYHVPYHDEKALAILLKFIEWYKPDYHIRLGDIWDFYQLSKFCRNIKTKADLQSDIDLGKRIIQEQQAASPNTRDIFIPGNHEERLKKYIWQNARDLELDCLELPNLLGLRELKIKHAPADEGLMINGVFMAYHGSIVRKYSGWTAKAEYEKNGCCGISGHCHRGGEHDRTNRGGEWGWWENYCLCLKNPEYIKHPDWQHGFRTVTFFKERLFHVADAKMLDYRVMFGDKLFD